MRRIPVSLVLIFLFTVSVSAQLKTGQEREIAGPTFKTYHNPRFEYSISYPPKVLIPQPIAANGDGREFLSEDGRTIMLVYGQENVRDETLREIYQETSESITVSYKTLKKNWFVVSGLKGDKIFYRKTIYRNDQFLTFSIEYPNEEKAVMDRITATIAKSFR